MSRRTFYQAIALVGICVSLLCPTPSTGPAAGQTDALAPHSRFDREEHPKSPGDSSGDTDTAGGLKDLGPPLSARCLKILRQREQDWRKIARTMSAADTYPVICKGPGGKEQIVVVTAKVLFDKDLPAGVHAWHFRQEKKDANSPLIIVLRPIEGKNLRQEILIQYLQEVLYHDNFEDALMRQGTPLRQAHILASAAQILAFSRGANLTPWHASRLRAMTAGQLEEIAREFQDNSRPEFHHRILRDQEQALERWFGKGALKKLLAYEKHLAMRAQQLAQTRGAAADAVGAAEPAALGPLAKAALDNPSTHRILRQIEHWEADETQKKRNRTRIVNALRRLKLGGSRLQDHQIIVLMKHFKNLARRAQWMVAIAALQDDRGEYIFSAAAACWLVLRVSANNFYAVPATGLVQKVRQRVQKILDRRIADRREFDALLEEIDPEAEKILSVYPHREIWIEISHLQKDKTRHLDRIKKLLKRLRVKDEPLSNSYINRFVLFENISRRVQQLVVLADLQDETGRALFSPNEAVQLSLRSLNAQRNAIKARREKRVLQKAREDQVLRDLGANAIAAVAEEPNRGILQRIVQMTENRSRHGETLQLLQQLDFHGAQLSQKHAARLVHEYRDVAPVARVTLAIHAVQDEDGVRPFDITRAFNIAFYRRNEPEKIGKIVTDSLRTRRKAAQKRARALQEAITILGEDAIAFVSTDPAKSLLAEIEKLSQDRAANKDALVAAAMQLGVSDRKLTESQASVLIDYYADVTSRSKILAGITALRDDEGVPVFTTFRAYTFVRKSAGLTLSAIARRVKTEAAQVIQSRIAGARKMAADIVALGPDATAALNNPTNANLLGQIKELQRKRKMDKDRLASFVAKLRLGNTELGATRARVVLLFSDVAQKACWVVALGNLRDDAGKLLYTPAQAIRLMICPNPKVAHNSVGVIEAIKDRDGMLLFRRNTAVRLACTPDSTVTVHRMTLLLQRRDEQGNPLLSESDALRLATCADPKEALNKYTFLNDLKTPSGEKFISANKALKWATSPQFTALCEKFTSTQGRLPDVSRDRPGDWAEVIALRNEFRRLRLYDLLDLITLFLGKEKADTLRETIAAQVSGENKTLRALVSHSPAHIATIRKNDRAAYEAVMKDAWRLTYSFREDVREHVRNLITQWHQHLLRKLPKQAGLELVLLGQEILFRGAQQYSPYTLWLKGDPRKPAFDRWISTRLQYAPQIYRRQQWPPELRQPLGILNTFRNYYWQMNGRQPTDDESADYMRQQGIKEDAIAGVFAFFRQISLESPLRADAESTWLDVIPDTTALAPGAEIDRVYPLKPSPPDPRAQAKISAAL